MTATKWEVILWLESDNSSNRRSLKLLQTLEDMFANVKPGTRGGVVPLL